MTRIVAISDQHGNVGFDVPECDILIIGGDICPTYSHDVLFQKSWIETNFCQWAQRQPAKNIVVIAGNHDFVLERYGKLPMKDIILNNLYYLQDRGVWIENLFIWGTPWSLPFGPWAFMKPDRELEPVYAKIPEGTDIVVSHTPMYEFGDRTADGDRPGSKFLRAKMKEIQPKLFICGHIHEGYGHYKYENTLIKNASLRDEYYNFIGRPIIVEL